MKDVERGRPWAETSVGNQGPGRGLRWAQAGIACVLGLILLGFWVYVDFVQPAPFYTIKYDPEMPYLLNSLATFKSHPYAYFHHPGTPVELIGTILLAALKVGARLPSEALVEWTVANPEVFLRWAHGLIAIGSAATAALIVLWGRPIHAWPDLLTSSALAAAFFAVLPPHSFDSLAFWSHNSFAFFGGTLLLVLLWIRLRRAHPLAAWEMVLFGLLAGGMTAFQLYFATWVLGMGVAVAAYTWLETRRLGRGLAAALAVGISGFAGFVAATLPILHRYREFWWWVRGMVVHQGMFGAGPLGVTSLAGLGKNFVELWEGGGAVVLALSSLGVLTLGACALLRQGKERAPHAWSAMAVGLAAQFLVTTALILKHPRVTYLLALAGLLPVVLILAADGLDRLGRIGRIGVTFLSVGLVLAFLGSGSRSLDGHHDRLASLQASEREVERFLAEYSQEKGIPRDRLGLLWGFGAPSRCFALRFGNGFADRIFAHEIEDVCPREGLYNIWEGVIEDGLGGGRLEDNDQWDVLVVSQELTRQTIVGPGPAFVSSESGLAYYVREREP